MNKYVSKFDKATAPKGHNDTILAGVVFPDELKCPIGNAWGYLEGKSEMEPHAHPTDEVYLIVSGKGFCLVDGNRFPVIPGDIVTIPPNSEHTVECEEGETILWIAFWWEHAEN